MKNKSIYTINSARSLMAAAAALMALRGPVLAAAAEDFGLEEIIVTARKVSESLQRVPVAVSAISGAALERSFADDLQDLEGLAPNVVIDSFNAFPNAASISIRGISHTEIEKSFDPAIGVVVDGVFMGTNAQALIDNFDLARVEVLRGPQGTLFGKNTIGGTINIIRKRPQHEFSGMASYSFSRFDKHEVKTGINIPVQQDVVALRLAGGYAKSDGHITNTVNGEKLNGADILTLRGAVLASPNDNLEIYINVDHVRDRSDMAGLRNANMPTQLFAIPGLLGLAPGFPGYPADTGPFNEVRADVSSDAAYDTTAVSMEVTWDEDKYTLTSITAYRWVDEDVINDFDTENTAGFNSRRVQDHDQFTQELRIASKWSEHYDLVAGLYYYWSKYSLDQTVDLLTDWIPCGVLPGAFASFGCTQNGGANQTTKSYAAFLQGNIHLTSDLRVTLGGRYTRDRKNFSATPITFPVGSLGTGTDKESWGRFTPKVGLDYQANEQVMLYASFSSGFKSGGYNGRAGLPTSIGPYDPEKVNAYELGFKSELWDRRLRFNVAAFYNDYSDMQVELLRSVIGGTGQETVVQNAASAETYGMEMELLARPTERLTFSGTLGLLEAQYKDFTADIGLGGVTDNASLELRKAPKWQFSVGASYEQPLSDAGLLLFDLRYRRSGAMETTTQNFAFGRRPESESLDGAITFESADQAWQASVFGRNLTNDRYIIDGLAAGAVLSFTSVNMPRVWGVEIGVRF